MRRTLFRKAFAPSLFAAACKGNDIAVRSILEDTNTDVDFRDSAGKTALQHASFCNQKEIVGFLLKSGADIFKKDAQGLYSVHYASAVGSVTILNKLFSTEKGRSVINARTNSGATALHCATAYNHGPAVNVLLSHGASTRIANNRGFLPIHTASATKKCHHEILQNLLLQDPFSVNFPITQSGQTPLSLAAKSDDPDKVRILLVHGADVLAKDSKGETALHSLAKRHEGFPRKNEAEIARLICQKDASVLRERDSEGRTPIEWAKLYKKDQVLKVLLKFEK